jgi:integrase
MRLFSSANASAEKGPLNVAEFRITPTSDLRGIGSRMARAKYQRGSIKKIDNGRYVGRWRRYVETPDGEKAIPRKKIITKELAAKYRIAQDYTGPLTKADAQRLLDVLIAEDTGKYIPPDSATTFEQVARQYIDVKEPRWGSHADATTKSVIQKHLIGNLGRRRVDELTAVEIQMFINGMVRNDASHSLLQKAVTHLRAILEQAEELGIIKRNPMRSRTVRIEYKSRKRKSERYLSLEECRALLSVLSGRDHLIIRMFIQLGLRPEELFALRRNDAGEEFIRIDEAFTKGQIKETKTEESAVNVYVPPDLMVELRTWMNSTNCKDEDWLFPASHRRGSATFSPISQNNYRNRVLKPAARRAGISGLDLLTLRRTCATHFGQKANTKDTQAQMRHADPLTTLKYYQQSIPESVKTAAVALEAEILKKPKQSGETAKAAGKTKNAARAPDPH